MIRRRKDVSLALERISIFALGGFITLIGDYLGFDSLLTLGRAILTF